MLLEKARAEVFKLTHGQARPWALAELLGARALEALSRPEAGSRLILKLKGQHVSFQTFPEPLRRLPLRLLPRRPWKATASSPKYALTNLLISHAAPVRRGLSLWELRDWEADPDIAADA